jgi:hypothetical protein
MVTSKNEKVQNFLNELKATDFESFEIVTALRQIVLDTFTESTEKIMYGGIVFFVKAEMISGVFVYKNHSTLELSNGFLMKDPKGYLEGKGKYRRHIKIKDKADILNKEVAFYVGQIEKP